MFVTRDFQQGLDCVIVIQFAEFVEIQFPEGKESEYTPYEVVDTDGTLGVARDKAVNELKKTIGIAYVIGDITYMVPITSEDAMGLLQVKAGFELGLTNTTLSFSNGVNMPVTATDFTAFAIWFALERNKFFV